MREPAPASEAAALGLICARVLEDSPLILGHGHVTPRPDGVLARCGGPALCSACRDEARLQRAPITPPAAAAAATSPFASFAIDTATLEPRP